MPVVAPAAASTEVPSGVTLAPEYAKPLAGLTFAKFAPVASTMPTEDEAASS